MPPGPVLRQTRALRRRLFRARRPLRLSSIWHELTRRFIPGRPAFSSPEARRRAEVTLFLALVWIPLALIRSFVFFAHDVGWQGPAVLLAGALGCTLPWLLRWTGSLPVFGNAVAFVWYLTLTSLCIVRGGIGSPATVGLAVLPLGVTFMAGSRSGVAWGAAVAVEVACFYALERAGVSLPDRLPEENRSVVQAIGAVSLTVALTWFAVAYERTTTGAIEALRRLERSSRALLEAIPDVGFRISREGLTLAVYGRREQLEKAPAWTTGSSIDLVTPELSGTMRSAIARALDSGQIVRLELEASVARERRQLEARFAASGANEVFVLLRDLTEMRTLARRLSDAEHEAQLLRADRLASMGQLAATVAHEANNPLAYVIANLSFVQAQLAELRGAELDAARPALEEALTESQQGADRVRQIVHKLKAFSRVDEDEQRAVSVPSVMESTLKMAANEIRHRARLTKHYGGIPHVLANEGRLAQVFLNLLVNAAQAIEPGQADANEIRVFLDRDAAGCAVIEISDTGVGIPPEHLARVTEPFFTTKPIGVGTGLGLTVCKNIVERLQGKLELTSSVGAGTTARVVVPAAEHAALRDDDDAHCAVLAPRRYRVLAIDDDPLVLKALRRALRRHDLTTVASGAEALELLVRDSAFQVILCDVMMPDVTGIDVYRRLETLGRGLERRVVFMSGGTFTEEARAFFASGPAQRLDKPFSPEALEQALRTAADESG